MTQQDGTVATAGGHAHESKARVVSVDEFKRLDPETWEIIEAFREAIEADLAALSTMPRQYTRDEALVDDLPDFLGTPYEKARE